MPVLPARALVVAVLLITGIGPLTGQTLAFDPLSATFSNPVDITGAGDGSDRLFIVERAGRIRVYDLTTDQVVGTDLLDISGQTISGGERGLLGLAFHPDFANNGHFYVNYTTQERNGLAAGTTVIARFTANAARTQAAPGSEQVLLTVDQPYGNHNAGDLAFGPDGLLYIPLGDGGSGGDPQNFSQNFQSLLGKLLRIDVDNPDPGLNYGIPAGNPYTTPGDNIPDEIWATGLRNPWRFSFDRQTGDMWIGDVGQSAREEIDFLTAGTGAGTNFGWDCREGDIAFTSSPSPECNGRTFTDPYFDVNRDNTTGAKSITGGFVYRGPSSPDLQGLYISNDFVTRNFFVLNIPGSGSTPLAFRQSSNIQASTFGEDDNGELYVANFSDGSVSRVTTVVSLPVELVSYDAVAAGKSVRLRWVTASEREAADFSLEHSTDGTTFVPLAAVAAENAPAGADYTYTHATPRPGLNYYRLSQTDLDGISTDLGVRSVNVGGVEQLSVFPNPTGNGRFTINNLELQQEGPVTVRLFDAAGRVVYERVRYEAAGRLRLEQRADLRAGLYRLVVSLEGREIVGQLVVSR